MAIYLTKESKVLVQGMTGAEGMKHTRRMLAAGTDVVGGVNPRKAGRTVDFDDRAVPVFGSVREGIEHTGADVTVVFVPPAFARAAAVEAADAGIGLAVVITEGIPVHDAVALTAHAKARGTRVIGPNCPGLITPGQSNAGIIPPDITKPGRIGLVSKSGTLTYQLMHELRDTGFSTCVGIGGDPVVGTSHVDCLAAFQEDPDTELIVLIGEGSDPAADAYPQRGRALLRGTRTRRARPGVRDGVVPGGTGAGAGAQRLLRGRGAGPLSSVSRPAGRSAPAGRP